jgi:hypothetical protein
VARRTNGPPIFICSGSEMTGQSRRDPSLIRTWKRGQPSSLSAHLGEMIVKDCHSKPHRVAPNGRKGGRPQIVSPKSSRPVSLVTPAPPLPGTSIAIAAPIPSDRVRCLTENRWMAPFPSGPFSLCTCERAASNPPGFRNGHPPLALPLRCQGRSQEQEH